MTLALWTEKWDESMVDLMEWIQALMRENVSITLMAID